MRRRDFIKTMAMGLAAAVAAPIMPKESELDIELRRELRQQSFGPCPGYIDGSMIKADTIRKDQIAEWMVKDNALLKDWMIFKPYA